MKNLMRSLLLLMGVALCVCANSSNDEQAVAMSPVDLLNIPSLRGPVLSPDGDRIVYTKSVSDWKKNRQVGNLWLADTRTGESRQLTFNSRAGAVAWSPDGKAITFLSKREGDSHRQVYSMPMNGGEPFPITKHKASVRSYQWSDDGRFIYFLSSDPRTKKDKEKHKHKKTISPFERPSAYRHVWRMEVASGEKTKLTDGEYFITGFDVSPNGRFVAVNRTLDPTLDGRHKGDIWIVPTNGDKARQLTSNSFSEGGMEISPDNKQILFISDVNEKGEYYYDANLFLVSVADGNIKPLAMDQTFEVEDAQWGADSRSVYVQANMGVRSELWRINVARDSATQLTDGKHNIQNWRYSRQQNRHVFLRITPHNPGDIWHMPGSGGKMSAATKEFADLAQRYRLPEQKLVRWKGADGVEVEGLLTLPLDYEEGKRYPLVTHTHGGPRSSDQYGQFRWRTYIPVLAARGYAYFTPNYRGGRGNGDDFMRDMVGGYFRNAHLDVMSGVDHLIEQGIADPEALIICGWSAGGHMTNKLITFTDRFKAASSGAGAVEWMSMYGESDVRYGRTPWFGGTPWQKNAPLDVYREHSPLKDLWKVKTPTIIFVGGNDVRVPPSQSMMLHRALRDLGVETDLYIAPGEPHGFHQLEHRLFKINAELDWFERHALGREYDWQPLPKE